MPEFYQQQTTETPFPIEINLEQMRSKILSLYQGPPNEAPILQFNTPETIIQSCVPIDVLQRSEFNQAHLNNYFKEEQGADLSVLKNKIAISPCIHMGWGHLVQAESAIRDTLLALDLKAVVAFDPVQFESDKEKELYLVLQQFFEKLQSGQDMHNFMQNIGTESRNVFDRIFFYTAKKTLQMVVASRGFDTQDNSFVGNIAKGLTERIERNPRLSRTFLQTFATLQMIFSEIPLTRITKKILEITKGDLVIATHPAGVRFNNSSMDTQTLNAIPDAGYVIPQNPKDAHESNIPPNYINHGHMLVPFASEWNVWKTKNNHFVNTVPTPEVKEAMDLLFNPSTETEVIGTLSDSIGPKEFINKWSSDKRTILLPTTGNGTNIGEIQKAVLDYINVSSKRTAGYELVVFLGEHDDEKVGMEFLQVLEQHPEIKVVRTKDKFETAKEKNAIVKTAHIQLRSGGENVMDSPNMGCVPVCTWSNVLNEVYNTHWGMNQGWTIPSAYPATTYNKWSEYLADVDKSKLNQPCMEKSYDNFVDYIDSLFDENQLAQKAAITGFIEANPQANLHFIMLATQMLLNRHNGRNEITRKEIDAIGKYMAQVKADQRQERTHALAEAGFILMDI